MKEHELLRTTGDNEDGRISCRNGLYFYNNERLLEFCCYNMLNVIRYHCYSEPLNDVLGNF